MKTNTIYTKFSNSIYKNYLSYIYAQNFAEGLLYTGSDIVIDSAEDTFLGLRFLIFDSIMSTNVLYCMNESVNDRFVIHVDTSGRIYLYVDGSSVNFGIAEKGKEYGVSVYYSDGKYYPRLIDYSDMSYTQDELIASVNISNPYVTIANNYGKSAPCKQIALRDFTFAFASQFCSQLHDIYRRPYGTFMLFGNTKFFPLTEGVGPNFFCATPYEETKYFSSTNYFSGISQYTPKAFVGKKWK